MPKWDEDIPQSSNRNLNDSYIERFGQAFNNIYFKYTQQNIVTLNIRDTTHTT